MFKHTSTYVVLFLKFFSSSFLWVGVYRLGQDLTQPYTVSFTGTTEGIDSLGRVEQNIIFFMLHFFYASFFLKSVGIVLRTLGCGDVECKKKVGINVITLCLVHDRPNVV